MRATNAALRHSKNKLTKKKPRTKKEYLDYQLLLQYALAIGDTKSS